MHILPIFLQDIKQISNYVRCDVPKSKKQNVTTYVVYLVYLHCEIHHKSPYNVRFGPGKVLEKSLVLIHQNLW